MNLISKRKFQIVLQLFLFTFCSVLSATEPVVLDVVDVAPAWSGHSVGYCLLTGGGNQYVAYYDDERRMTVAQRQVDEETWVFNKLSHRVNWDSHHYITMAMDSEGFLHVSGNMHSDPLIYYRTTRPYDVTTLERAIAMTGQNELKVTYPQFIKDSDNQLLFLYRDGKSGDGRQLVNRYDATTQKWIRLMPASLFDGLGRVSCYPEGPVLGPDGYFHLVWVWRVHGGCETNHNLSYARTKDMAHWETATGEALTLPITPDTAGTLIDPVPVEGGMINESTVVGFDTQGRVILSYHKFDSAGNTQIYNARFEGESWTIIQTSDWGHRWYFSGGGTIEVDVDLGPVRISPDGRLTQGFSHVKYGSGVWVLDEATLKPMETLRDGKSILKEHDTPTSQYPNMAVRWKEDENQSVAGDSKYFLRWEAPLVTRDKRSEKVADPVTLKVYRIQNTDSFDPRMSCIHDGYF
jgi:hypothetical protein